MLRSLLFGSAAFLRPLPAFAQDVSPDSSPSAPAADAEEDVHADPHSPEQQQIIVTGFTRNRADLLSGVSVVSGEELNREVRTTIGETLARQPGVSSTAFGPNASRPVLRGFQGDRIRILTDGIGSLDASSSSVDHSVAINPLTADRIEVLRGPSALLFGSAAIGGVVNVIDARIPRRMPGEAVHAEGLLTYGSAAEEISGNAAIDVPVGGGFVFHLDGNYTHTDDLRIGGFVLAPGVRAQAAASPDPDIRALAGLEGRIANTAAETSDVAAGLAWIGGGSHAGFSVNRYDSLYGVPVRHSLDPAIEAEAPTIDVRQTRVDGRAEIDAGEGFLDMVRLRGAFADYRHFEIEENGDIASTFLSEGWEGRIEARQTERNGWGGGFGAQYFQRDFEILGDEKFLPPNHTRQYGLFVLQTLDLGSIRVEAGGRYEHSDLSADADPDLGNPALTRDFDAFTASAGASIGRPELRFGANLSHTQRAPSAEELFAQGPHAGTQSFEIGDPDLSVEKSWGVEGTFNASGDGYSFTASIFHSWFDGYIYQQPTGAIQDDLPVFEYRQDDARYFGFELEGSVRLARIGGFTLNADAVADYVRASIDNVGPAPRIPPLRLLGGLEAQSERVDGRVEIEWVSGQDRIAAFETPTDDFVMVNLSVAIHPFGDANRSSLMVSVNNLFDVEARRHASLLKDFAPLAGRDVRVTARLTF
ncbi:MAG: TonB-dependent receptor [Sphingosinicella sp.]